MSGNATMPGNANPMMPWRAMFIVQAARGPILLITVGVLFAMHEAGFLLFSRTWPLILIVLGVMKLIERVVMPAQPMPPMPGRPPYMPPPPPMGGPRV